MLEKIIKLYGFVDYTDSDRRTFKLSEAVLSDDGRTYRVPVMRNNSEIGAVTVNNVLGG